MTASVGRDEGSDSVDSASLGDSFWDIEELCSPGWRGRDIQLQNMKHHKRALISQFYINVLREVKEVEHAQVRERRYGILDFTQEKIEESASDFDHHLESSPRLTLHVASRREFALADPVQFQTEIAQCRDFWKRVGKGATPDTNKLPSPAQFLQKNDKLGDSLLSSPECLHAISARPKRLSTVACHSPQKSCFIKTEGFDLPGMRIGFINGMATSFEGVMEHLEHIKKLAGGISVKGVYNHSNDVPADLSEIFLLNYPGFASITSDLLVKEWMQFHEENKDNPDVKYLYFAHSQGTILTMIALSNAPPEIRDRVIVVAIGPAVIIPDELCYRSYNYASKDDPVNLGENIVILNAFGSPQKAEHAEILKKFLENKKRLILLDSDPNDKGIKHDFENGIFVKVIQDHIRDYYHRNGQYK